MSKKFSKVYLLIATEIRELLAIRLYRYEKNEGNCEDRRTQIIHNDYVKVFLYILTVVESSVRWM